MRSPYSQNTFDFISITEHCKLLPLDKWIVEPVTQSSYEKLLLA